MKSKVSSNRTVQEIEQLLSQIELIKGKQARLKEVNKQLGDIERNISKTSRNNSVRDAQDTAVNAKNGDDNINKNNRKSSESRKYDFQKNNLLQRSEAIEREMKKLKENIGKGT